MIRSWNPGLSGCGRSNGMLSLLSSDPMEPGSLSGIRHRRVTVASVFALALCGCYRPATVAGFPTTIGSEPAVFRLPAKTPDIGPQFRVYLQVSDAYRIELGSRANPCAIYGPNNSIVHLDVAWVAIDGTRHPLERPGCRFDRESRELEFFSSVVRPAQPLAAAIVLSSDSRVTIVRARWWSGDPASLCFMCL